ncbi:MAG TPA: MBOAT family protein [Telluria sp.]|nr:MBOAT family protein [Telluria sp.]
MLFNSCAFLFLYLPPVWAGYYLLGRRSAFAATAWLGVSSLFFYGWWDVRFLPLLLVSIVFNCVMARALMRAAEPWRRRLLLGALAANLAALAWFKYTDFLLEAVGFPAIGVLLPIGISFFTFTQIALLVDCYRREVGAYRLTEYALFVSYFPHLIAGPVLHHKTMMPQFANPSARRPDAAHIALGVTIFVIGLAKKVLIADNLAPLANPVFAAGAHPPLVEAWTGVLAYTFQLYFDFSGYSDMAIGLSRLFGVRLPENFNAPYKAVDIGEFWRRWHMTLSQFLRDYLYIPLGGNRYGSMRRYRNLMLTMLLGGLWHGAGWNFVVWGGLHGAYLSTHQLWRARIPWRMPRPLAQGLTFLAVCFAWVFFRASDLPAALDVLRGLIGMNGIGLPHVLAGLQPWLPHADFGGLRWIQLEGPGLPALALASALAFAAPTTAALVATRWRPTPRWALASTALFVVSVFTLNRPTEFLYFQF